MLLIIIYLNSIISFLGHLHPVLVHLPIGLLLGALLLQWLSARPNRSSLAAAVPLLLLLGAITSLFTAISGYLLSITDDYDKQLVTLHMWMGIATTFLALLLYAKAQNPAFPASKKLLSIGLLLVIIITGHLGGSLTHGADYLTKPLQEIFSPKADSAKGASLHPIANVQEAVAYQDIIEPILSTKCYSCHNANKQKGGLRMDDTSLLLKGGKDGIVIQAGDANGSEMMKRIALAIDNDDHMPPREKAQLNEKEIALLHWWIASGASFSKPVKALAQTPTIQPILQSLQQTAVVLDTVAYIPKTSVAAADTQVMHQLKNMGILVLPIAQNTPYVMANCLHDSILSPQAIQLLLKLKAQLVWLNLNGTAITDAQLSLLLPLQQLTKLNLAHTHITGKAVATLVQFPQLRSLNLVGNTLHAKDVLPLQALHLLQHLYLYQTNITDADWPMLAKAFPTAQIDTGGYKVPTLVSDTTEVKVMSHQP